MVIHSTTIITRNWFEVTAKCRGYGVCVSLKPWRRLNDTEGFLSVTLFRYYWSARRSRSARRLRVPW